MIFRVFTFFLMSVLLGLGSYVKAQPNGPIAREEFTVVGADCNHRGSIILNTVKPATYRYVWTNSANSVIGNGSAISGQDAGDYKLQYSPDAGITSYTLNFTIRDFNPIAATQDLTIPCGESFLRVHADNFSATPVVKYAWEDAAGRDNGSSEFSLLAPGQYYLIVTNSDGCVSNRASITVRQSPARPAIYEASKIVTNSSCTANDGSITGIDVVSSQAEPLKFKWINAAGETVGTEKDIYNLAPGKYRLIATPSQESCESISTEITIRLKNPITSNTLSVVAKKADCEQPNGSIKGVVTNATSYHWINVKNEVVATTLDLVDVAVGFYRLVLSNDFGCTDTLGQFHVQAGNLPIRFVTQPVIKPDNCGKKIGSITGISVLGSGVRYRWTDDSGTQVSTDADLRNATSGTYHLLVSNPTCSESYDFYIPEVDLSLPTPIIGDKFICSPTQVLINFDVEAPLYRIYDENGTLIEESKSKNFMLNIKENSTFYAAVANGTCESAQTTFKVTIGEAALKIPTSFTPNGDGVNDKWVLKGLEVYNSAHVKIFNRYGSVVYESSSTSSLFEGRSDGKELPAGVYYYIIKLTNECNPFTGSVTIIR